MIKFLDVKRAYYADPENVRVEYWDGSKWWRHHADDPDWTQADDWRIRPRTIRIGEIDVQEPVRSVTSMTYGGKYWTFSILEDDFVTDFIWENDKSDLSMLKAGLVHLTKEAAIAHAKALILVSGGKIDD